MSWSTLYTLGAIQALFLAFLLFVTRNQRWSGNIYLSGLLLIIAGLLVIFALRIEFGNRIYPWLFWPIVSTPALIGPCVLFYLRSLQSKFEFFRWSTALHVLPFLLLMGLFIPEIFSAPTEGLAHLDDASTRVKIQVAAYLKSGLIIVYLIYCLFLLGPARIHSSLKAEAARFLRITLGLFLCVALVGSVLSTLFWLGVFFLPAADHLELSFLTLITYLLAFYIFYFDLAPINPKARYVNPALTNSARKQLAKTLDTQIEQQRLVTHPEYSASFVASRLSISEQQLSEVIALEFNCNFNSLSNRARFEYFTELLSLKPGDTLLDLAFEAGFKSKSSFNRTVKERTGVSPSEYRKQQLNTSLSPN